MTTIHTDVADTYDTTAALSDDGAVDAFLTSFKVEPDDEEDAPKKKKPSEEVEAEEHEDAAEDEGAEGEDSEETPEDEAEGDEEEATEEDAPKKDKKYVDSDETYVKVRVGDEDKEVSVKDLKRLYGQEASLTRKSQEVAEQRKLADAQTATHVAALNVMLEKAKAKAAPYAAIDWLAVSKNPAIDAETASALRDEAKAALDDVAFFEKDLGSLMDEIKEKNKAATATQAKACIASLSTKGTEEKPNALYIEGWNDKVYDDIRSFARGLGADPHTISALVDPFAFKILHMAMQFKKGSSKVLTVKAKKSPTKIVKSSSSTATRPSSSAVNSRSKAVSNLKRSGSEEHAVEAFLAGMTDRD